MRPDHPYSLAMVAARRASDRLPMPLARALGESAGGLEDLLALVEAQDGAIAVTKSAVHVVKFDADTGAPRAWSYERSAVEGCRTMQLRSGTWAIFLAGRKFARSKLSKADADAALAREGWCIPVTELDELLRNGVREIEHELAPRSSRQPTNSSSGSTRARTSITPAQPRPASTPPPAESGAPMSWEYKVLEMELGPPMEQQLNALGAVGWELVGFVIDNLSGVSGMTSAKSGWATTTTEVASYSESWASLVLKRRR